MDSSRRFGNLGCARHRVIGAGIATLICSQLATGQAVMVGEPGKISKLSHPELSTLANGYWFGASVAELGDLGAGGTAIAVGAPQHGNGGDGEVRIVFLDATGLVTSSVTIDDGISGFPTGSTNSGHFGSAVAYLGSLGPGALTLHALAIGDDSDDDGGFQHGAVHIVFLNPDGTVAPGAVKISDVSGSVMVGLLDDLDNFGTSLAALGDVDGDGRLDLAVGAIGDDDGFMGQVQAGAVWILSLEGDGSVQVSPKKISNMTEPTLMLGQNDVFSEGLAYLGDLGSGAPSLHALAVGSIFENGTMNPGRVHILFLDNGFSLVGVSVLANNSGGLTAGLLGDGDRFGGSLAALGDVDGDGKVDLAVGAEYSDDGGTNAGALWLMSLAPDGTATSAKKFSALEGCFAGALEAGDAFGTSVAVASSLGGSALSHVLVGAILDDDGGTGSMGLAADVGAVWLLPLEPCPVASWFNYGSGVPGALGIPALVSLGDPVIGEPVTICCGSSSGVFASLAWLAIGVSPASAPAFCGTLLVDPLGISFYLAIPSGGAPVEATIPCGPALCGAKVYLQTFQQDVAACKGIAISRGLQLDLGS